jgi:hypothetical protein
MRLRLPIAAFLALVMLVLPVASVAAAPGRVPPGNSAASQYHETLPGAGGNEQTRDIGGEGGRAPAKVLGHANAARLEALGPEGRAAAQFAAQSAPNNTARQPHGVGGASNPSGSSALSQVLGQLTGSSGSGGMGLLLPLLIAMTIVGAAAYALGRRRIAHPRD